MRVPTVKKVQRRMKLLADTISSLTRRQTRKRQAISYGPFNASLPPNTNPMRTPAAFTGGN